MVSRGRGSKNNKRALPSIHGTESGWAHSCYLMAETEERRETESNLRGLVLRGDLRGKRPGGRASWKSGPVQGQKRTGALGQGRGTLSHCPGQAQSLVGLLQQEDTE